jgi:hypothetical protein
MGCSKRLYEDIYCHEDDKYIEYLIMYTKDKMFFEKYGDDMELIGFEKYEDSGLGDDQPSNA